MISNLTKVSEREVLRNWAIAEAVSVRRLPYLEGSIPQELFDKLNNGQQQLLSESDWAVLVQKIQELRAPLLKGLLRLGLKWYRGELLPAELEQVMIMNWAPFVGLAPSRRLADLVTAFERGKMPPKHHEFAANLARIRENLNAEAMAGLPIFVGRSEKPPYYLVEGFTRCSAILLNKRRRAPLPERIQVILGVSQRLDEWRLDDDPSGTRLL